ncbi:PBSX family phage terminase large subunit [Brevibacillus laterosporus]|uniref:PBSX family phage terminase large subunit n=1 Tax=Brevibacillus laterosporus TaxID=1465 RepID=A0AAP3DJU4_BRELA|nr:PBSX family phage terminase large subunit [Brevibacillus laterosporus]MCR8982658.1 PBSX family phage terminase large subunit [Brevibacillus laterosporus]MCZ0809814.1 PBSX family phage terminase large subunit [Brevibacillus laterosporus]MCZ0828352.1 PBSX family phage terminase large subunit [Brevibacillus laterosporus]MCZ0852362.1 PBSX family phage terminase large subunit [Brevibacillus laterosporus]
MVEKEVNPHFEEFLFNWDHKFYFLVGGYGSSKSYHVALKLILKLLEEKRTALVIREVYDTIRDSCFTLFEDIVTELELDEKIRFVTSPMQIRFPNGSKIIFKGMDKPAKLKSIHNVSIIWIEECSEVKYDGFKELLGRLRHPTMKLHMILSTNPVSTSNWCYKHFFKNTKAKHFILDDKDLYKERVLVVKDTYYHHSTADDNLFLPASYIEQLDELKIHDPDLHRIARKGRFGVNGVIVFPQFQSYPHSEVMQAIERIRRPIMRAGMDFGFQTSYNALLRLAVDHGEKILYIYWEYYKNQMTDDKTAEEIDEFRRSGELIKADSAEPKTISFFRQKGFNMRAAKKFQGSREQYTKKIKRFKKIICSDQCPNTIEELKELTFAVDKQGEILEDEFTIDPHTLSAIWYALDDYEVSDLKGGSVSFD